MSIVSKPHFNILDGLRGAAALMVVWYHVFEGFAFAEAPNGAGDGLIKTFNHGYLAVDFFFMLSGFVISYAYDSRWQGMSVGKFFKRRLVRLHPMVIIGAITIIKMPMNIIIMGISNLLDAASPCCKTFCFKR